MNKTKVWEYRKSKVYFILNRDYKELAGTFEGLKLLLKILF